MKRKKKEMTYAELSALAKSNASEQPCSPRWLLNQTTAELERLARDADDPKFREMCRAALSSRIARSS